MRSVKDILKDTMRADREAVEKIRSRASWLCAADRAKYYRNAYERWLSESVLGGKEFARLFLVAAALDGVQLEDEHE